MIDTSEALEGEGSFEEVKKPVKEVPVILDTGTFDHDTGDKYEGTFECKKKDRSCKMHGPGVYTTAEGDLYSGSWENDKLVGQAEDAVISFVDGSKYTGMFRDWCYSGRGRYTYPDSSEIACDFADNCPTGNLVLTDPNGHTWLGRADSGFGWFEPVNHYYYLLQKPRDSKVAPPRPKEKGKKNIS